VTERKQCTQSSHSGRHSVYTASRQSAATYGCSRPKTSRRVTKPFSEIWFRDLQLLESGSEKIRQTVVRESEVNRWLYVVLIYSERRLHERSDWLICQIFIGKINIREDKLLLYHCLLELGLPKVSVSEHYLWFFVKQYHWVLWLMILSGFEYRFVFAEIFDYTKSTLCYDVRSRLFLLDNKARSPMAVILV
jgi:hypothetical protein